MLNGEKRMTLNQYRFLLKLYNTSQIFNENVNATKLGKIAEACNYNYADIFNFLKELITQGVIYTTGEKEKSSMLYAVNKKELIKYLESIEEFQLTHKMMGEIYAGKFYTSWVPLGKA